MPSRMAWPSILSPRQKPSSFSSLSVHQGLSIHSAASASLDSIFAHQRSPGHQHVSCTIGLLASVLLPSTPESPSTPLKMKRPRGHSVPDHPRGDRPVFASHQARPASPQATSPPQGAPRSREAEQRARAGRTVLTAAYRDRAAAPSHPARPLQGPGAQIALGRLSSPARGRRPPHLRPWDSRRGGSGRPPRPEERAFPPASP